VNMSLHRDSVTIDDLMQEMGGPNGGDNWRENTATDPSEIPQRKLLLDPLEKKPISDLSPETNLDIDVNKEENELIYYKEKLAEQVEATREILGNFQLISRRSKVTEGLAERYKDELNKHKEYLSHLLEQQSAALSTYKTKILDLNREKTAYRSAYRELRQEFESYQEKAHQYFKQLSQSNDQIERYKVYIKKMEDMIKLQYEKKEFYKNELRKRVLQEKEFYERENAYLHKIHQYEKIILRLRQNNEINENENQQSEEDHDNNPEQNNNKEDEILEVIPEERT